MITALVAFTAIQGQYAYDTVRSAQGVVERILGESPAAQFSFEPVPPEGGMEVYNVIAQDGIVHISGSSAVAMCRGAYDYLKNACHCQVSWSGDNIKIPTVMPAWASGKVVCPNQYRHYFNVCTFGYTTVWWDWKRWQHEIDWMALHGINMPLAMNGQEKIWQKVFRDLGEPDSSIRAHFTGAAFLPWHRMGNVDKHMGPLPQSWIDGQAELQKKILERERELGMTPVVPGFSGFVPVDFDKIHPDVRLSSPTAWAGFTPTKFVDPLSPMFVEIGRKFIEAYRKEFGSDHLYLCDTFNEQDPQFPAPSELEDLHATGKAVYDSIHSADPDGIWVMQGWLFYNAGGYWKPQKTAAMLNAVPPGKLIALDLASNEHEVWREQPAVRDSGWIFNTLHNYGQTTNLLGNLQHFADVAYAAETDPNHGRMLGMGLTPEGIDQNPVVYELMTDLMWRSDHVNVADWIHGYVASRYGSAPQKALDAWSLLQQSVYSSNDPWERDSWRVRPSGSVNLPPKSAPKVLEASKDLLAAAPQLKDDTLYRRDLVDVTKTWLSTVAETHLAVALASFDDNRSDYQTHKAKFFEALHDLDRLMATRPEHRLSTWIKDSRTWGANAAEKNAMEHNARMQVTVWGGPELFDYANKEWAGLNEDFIRRRWELYFAALEATGSSSKIVAPDFLTWELKWAMTTTPIKESKPEDSIAVASDVIRKYQNDPLSPEAMLHIDPDPGIAVGKPVTSSGGTEGAHRPELAFDGSITGDYWSASPSPQWIQVDLQSTRQLDGVWLFPYYGDGRYYQYKIDVSLDGQSWKTLVDESANTRVSTFRGYKHRFSPTTGRYVRVTMLKNSANTGVHLYEVRVFGK